MIERLTKKINENRRKYKIITNADLYPHDYVVDDSCIRLDNAVDKLGQLEDIEQELGIDLVALFDSEYTSTKFEMELEEDDKTIYFDGDSFYGHYSAKEFLQLIKDMLSMYKQLIKLGH